MALGDHLRAHQNIVGSLAKPLQDGFVLALGGDRVAIQPRDPRFGKLVVQLLFHLLRADPQKVDVFALALGAVRGHALGVVAVMAQQTAVAAVKRERDGTVHALHALAARAAGHEAGKPAAVQQDDGLLAVIHAVPDRVQQAAREGGLLARLQGLGAHVDQLHPRHGPFLHAPRQFQQRVLAALGVIPALEAGRGRTQHHARAGRLRAHDGHVAAVVARRFFLFIALVVLLVHHDQAQIAHGRENPGARAHHHRRRARANPPPLIGALRIAEGAVQNGHAIAEAAEELAGHGGRQGDFRHQQQRAAAAGQRRVDSVQVDLGLARSGHAMQQESAEFVRLNGGADLLEGGGLRRVERVRRAHRSGVDRQRFGAQCHQFLAGQRAGGRAGVANHRLQILQIVRAGMQFQEGQQFALRLAQFGGGRRARSLDAQALRRRAQRIALGLHLLHHHEAFALQRAQGVAGQGQLALQIRGG